MFRQGLKNFFKNLKYFFTPLGTIALGMVFGFSVLFPVAVSAVSTTLERLKEILGNSAIDFTPLRDTVVAAVEGLNWSNPWEALGTLISREFLAQTLNDCLAAIQTATEAVRTELMQALTDGVNTIVAGIVLFFFFTFLGLVGGYFLTSWLVRRNIAKRSLWKFIVTGIVDSLLMSCFTALSLWLSTLWEPGALIATVLSALLLGLVQLTEAYLVYARRKVKLKKIIGVKNILSLFLVNLAIFTIAALITVIAVAITNPLVGLFLGIPLFIIAFIVMGLNAETYTRAQIPAESEPPAEELPQAA